MGKLAKIIYVNRLIVFETHRLKKCNNIDLKKDKNSCIMVYLPAAAAANAAPAAAGGPAAVAANAAPAPAGGPGAGASPPHRLNT